MTSDDELLAMIESHGIPRDTVEHAAEVRELRKVGESWDPYLGARDVEILVHELRVRHVVDGRLVETVLPARPIS